MHEGFKTSTSHANIKEYAVIFFYRYFFYPAFFFVVYFFRYSHPKLKAYFRLRKKSAYKNTETGVIWFHCSSGEVEYAKPILRWLKATYPKEKILVTYFSNSFLESIKKIPEVDMVEPLPFDTKRKMREFLEHYQPKYLFVARTDLWPEMLYQAHAAKIPCILFAATLSEENPKFSNAIGRYLFQQLLNKLSLVICVSEEDAKRFRTFNIQHLEVATDTRYLQVMDRIKNPKKLPCQIKSTKPLVIFGSTWSQDENQMLPVFMDILAEGYQIILVPHEVSKKHLASLYEDMAYQCLSYAKWSKTSVWNKSEILVVDQVGYLAELYSYAEVAFVGGSFKKQVHSVMEALANGCMTYVGPKHKNNREAVDYQDTKIEGIQPVECVQDGKHLLSRLRAWKKQTDRKKFKQGLINEIEKRADEAKKTFEIIDTFIKRYDA
jgi:3-deoxy-D-manno-octulosonic-acid transferase